MVVSDKSRNKKRDGSPDKPTTPGAGLLEQTKEEAAAPEKQVIVDPEILAMQITPEQLEKVGRVRHCHPVSN